MTFLRLTHARTPSEELVNLDTIERVATSNEGDQTVLRITFAGKSGGEAYLPVTDQGTVTLELAEDQILRRFSGYVANMTRPAL